MSLADTLGFIAAFFTLLTFVQTAMIRMRIAAIAANLCFIAFGVLAPCHPVLALHLILLPINGSMLTRALRENYAQTATTRPVAPNADARPPPAAV